jgi:hypothetical protein
MYDILIYLLQRKKSGEKSSHSLWKSEQCNESFKVILCHDTVLPKITSSTCATAQWYSVIVNISYYNPFRNNFNLSKGFKNMLTIKFSNFILSPRIFEMHFIITFFTVIPLLLLYRWGKVNFMGLRP